MGNVLEEGNVVQTIRGPVGSGKTTTTMVKLLQMAMEQPPNDKGIRPTRWFIIRRTYEDLRKTAYADWCDQWRPLQHFRHTTASPMMDRFRFGLDDDTTVEAEFVFLALDTEDDVERFRGGNFTGGWCNEAKQLRLSHLETAVSRRKRYPSIPLGGVIVNQKIAVVLCDTNATTDEHWLHKREVSPPNRWKFYIQPPGAYKDRIEDQNEPWKVNREAENFQNLAPGYYEDLIGTYSNDRIRADLANIATHIQEGRAVYPEYLDTTHCTDQCKGDMDLPLIIGADGGLTPAVVFCQLSKRGQLRQIDELVADDVLAPKGIGVYQFWRDYVKPHIQANYANYSVGAAWFDPTGGNRGEGEGKSSIGFLNDDHRFVDDATGKVDSPLDLGFLVEPAVTNDPTKRLQAVKGYLTRMIDGFPAFLIHPRCKVTRRGFNGQYHFRKVQVTGPERFHEKPDKNETSHPHDSLQYAALAAAGGFVTDGDELDYEEWEDDSGASAITGY